MENPEADEEDEEDEVAHEPPPEPPSWFHATAGLWTGIGSFFSYLGGGIIVIAIVAGVVILALAAHGPGTSCITTCGSAGVHEMTTFQCVCHDPPQPPSQENGLDVPS